MGSIHHPGPSEAVQFILVLSRERDEIKESDISLQLLPRILYALQPTSSLSCSCGTSTSVLYSTSYPRVDPIHFHRAALPLLSFFNTTVTMKNLGNIVLLLAAGAGYVASLPAGDVPANQVRGYEAVNEILARMPKGKDAAGKSHHIALLSISHQDTSITFSQ